MAMVEKFENYIEGIGSVLDVFPAERDLSVTIPVPSNQNEAFSNDLQAIGGDFQRVIQQQLRHVKAPE